jgi:8-oxo-dGTP diphosphatase
VVYKEDCFHLGAKALIQSTDGKLLLLQKNPKKPHHKSTEQLWDLPGGRIHRNELLEEALKREVYEETGLSNISRIEPLTMVLSDIRIPIQESDVGLILAIYLCPILDNNPPIQLSEEHLHYVWALPKEAAKLLILSHPAQLIKRIGQLQVNSDKKQKEPYEATQI